MEDSVKNIYQIKIYLEGVSPMIWRRLEIDQDTSLLELHGIIQIVMGWENMHLHHLAFIMRYMGFHGQEELVIVMIQQTSP